MLSTGDNTDARVRQIEDDLTWGPFIPAVESGSSSLLERLAYYHTPGLTVAVIDSGEIAWSRGYGVLDAGTGQPVTPGTIFQACSISKHVAMVSTLHLVQDGVLDLDEDVNRYLTSWKLPANGHWEPKVTIRHLLGHTAGLTQNWYRGFRRGDSVPSLLQVLDGQPRRTPRRSVPCSSQAASFVIPAATIPSSSSS
jgi:CubicO group peptidase (beta-lactamase class C family)